MSERKTLLDLEQINRIYSTLLGMSVELDPDPLAHGPERLQLKTAQAQNMLSRLERILTQISHDHHVLSRKHLIQEKELGLKLDELIAKNSDVAGGSSYKDRLARAHMLLISEVESVGLTAVSLKDMEILTEVLKTKRSELKNLQQRLKDQFRICQEEISLGARWRHPRSNDLELTPGYTFATFDDANSFNILAEKVDDIVAEGLPTSGQAAKTNGQAVKTTEAISVEALIEEEGTGLNLSEADALLEALDQPSPEPTGDPDSEFDLEAYLAD